MKHYEFELCVGEVGDNNTISSKKMSDDRKPWSEVIRIVRGWCRKVWNRVNICPQNTNTYSHQYKYTVHYTHQSQKYINYLSKWGTQIKRESVAQNYGKRCKSRILITRARAINILIYIFNLGERVSKREDRERVIEKEYIDREGQATA